MTVDPLKCDPTVLSRAFDEELLPAEKPALGEHLKHCQACQEVIQDYQSISAAFHAGVEKAVSGAGLEDMELRILSRIPRPGWIKGAAFLRSKKFFIPAAAFAAGLALFVYLTGPPTPVSTPSAIINSFTGEITSVMILETPQTHQTILWFHEDPVSGEEDDGIQEA